MSDYQGYNNIKVEKEDGVAVLTLNRPEAMNAIDEHTHLELERVFPELDADEEVRAVVLTGAGKAFSAGGNIRGMLERAEQKKYRAAYHWRWRGPKRLIRNILDLHVPLIAAVNGAAVGLGTTLALFSDIIIASDKARFGDTHVSVGLVAGDGGAIIWPLLVGVAKAKEMLMTGAIIDAQEAQRIGLVNKVVPADQLMPTAMELAHGLASGPTIAISWTKMSVNRMIRHFLELSFDSSFCWEQHSFSSEDHYLAAKAFSEKRQPEFKGQ